MIAMAAAAMIAATTVYRLELTDEIPYIVGEDGVKRRVCIVDPDEYAMMTGRVDQVWQSLNSTNEGRTRLHGKRTEQIVDETNGVKVVVYADGYRHAEKLAVRNPGAKRAAGRKTADGLPRWSTRDYRISERQQKFRAELKSRNAAPVKTVTVEHNAATGEDIVK